MGVAGRECPKEAEVIVCTSEDFNSVGVHDDFTADVGENEERVGDAGESMMAAPHIAHDTWLWCVLPGVACASSSSSVDVDIGSIES